MRLLLTAASIVALVMLAPGHAQAYSVLTHEAIIDSAWDDGIRPTLDARFPHLTREQLREARAHAYGGSIIQDMGYYPFGSKLFTDLAHYVRSGEFVMALLADASDVNEYAFALGALAHYVADNDGHSLGINRAEALIYPKVRARYGPIVTYGDDPAAHLKTEFGFDVLEVVRNRYSSDAFHDFIGFEVDKDLLERAFRETYGLEVKDLFMSEALAIGSYRYSVGTLIPEMTKVAWQNKQDEIRRERPGMTREQFLYNLSKAQYAREWGNERRRPGPFAKFLSALFKLVPKVGPLRPLQFQMPGPDAAADFMHSVNATLATYHGLLAQQRAGRLALPDRNFDTGRPTEPGAYELADRAYAQLLDRLARKHFSTASPALRRNLLAFYGNMAGPNTTKRCRRMWQRTVRDLNELQATQPAGAEAPALRRP